MNILDIIIIVPLIWAAYKGFKEGMLVQLGGILGLILGVWLASKFGAKVGGWLHIGEEFAQVVGFIIVLLLVILSIALLGRFSKGLFKIAGLESLDTIGGVLFSVVKYALIMSVLTTAFDSINKKLKWVKQNKLESSVMYTPLKKTASFAFPYIETIHSRLLESEEKK